MINAIEQLDLNNVLNNYAALVFIVLGFIFAMYNLYINRYSLEKKFQSIEIAVDIKDVIKLSQINNISLQEALENLKTKGLTTIYISEVNKEIIEIVELIDIYLLFTIQGYKDYLLHNYSMDKKCTIITNKNIDFSIKEFKNTNISFGMVEFLKQEQNISIIPSRCVRVHTIFKKELYRYNRKKALDRYILASTDRNHRIIWVSIPNSCFVFKEFQSFLEDVSNILKFKGFSLGKASTFPLINKGSNFRYLTSLSIFSVVPLCINLIGYNINFIHIVPIYFFIVLIMYIKPYFAKTFLSLLAAVLFPTVSIIAFTKLLYNTNVITAFTVANTITFIGAFLIASLLSSPEYFLKLKQFRGVKLSYIIPPILIIIYIVSRLQLTESCISISNLYIFIIVLLVLVITILRSGNNGFYSIMLDLKLRDLLTKIFKVRPRTKEFLIGYPAMITLSFIGIVNIYTLPLFILAVIGQASVINTFAHMHTPLQISIRRTLNGLTLGVLIGTLNLITLIIINNL